MRTVKDTCKAEHACLIAATAGGTGDNTKVTSAVIDRLQSNGGLASSMMVAIAYSAALTDTKTVTATVSVLHGETTSPTTSVASLPATVIKTATASATVTDCYQFNVDLRGFGRYLKIEFTPDLSAANTDTIDGDVVVVLGGFDINPPV